MIKVKLTDKMIKMLEDMIGKTFCSYECASMFPNETYGNLRINLKDFSVEILNEVKDYPFFDLMEDISGFTCIKKPLNEKFKPFCDEPFKKYNVNEKITEIYVVNDTISVNNGEYIISFDMAIIIQGNKHKYVFSRGWFFSEVIDISVDKDFDNIYPVEKVIEDWSDEGENVVSVKRTIKNL